MLRRRPWPGPIRCPLQFKAQYSGKPLVGHHPHPAAHKGAWHAVVRQTSKSSQLGSLRTIHRGLPTNVRRL